MPDRALGSIYGKFNMNRRTLLTTSTCLAVATLIGLKTLCSGSTAQAAPVAAYAVTYPDAEWRRRLSPAAYAVLRQAGTEAPFTSPLLKEERAGVLGTQTCRE